MSKAQITPGYASYPEWRSGVPDQVDYLRHSLTELDDLVTRVEVNLIYVLGPPAADPKTQPDEVQLPSPPVPLAGELALLNSLAKSIHRRLTEIDSRLGVVRGVDPQ